MAGEYDHYTYFCPVVKGECAREKCLAYERQYGQSTTFDHFYVIYCTLLKAVLPKTRKEQEDPI